MILNKKDWERECKAWRSVSEDDQEDNDEEDPDQIIDEYYADNLLRADELEEYTYELEKGNEIVFGISSEDPSKS